MKKFLGPLAGACLVAFASTPASAQTPDQSAKLAEARAIIEIASPPAERQATIEKLMQRMIAPVVQNIKMDEVKDPGLKTLFKGFINQTFDVQRPVMAKFMPAMFDAMAVAYTHEFSLAELKDVHAFALTPAGRHFLSKSPAVAADPAVLKVIGEMTAATQERMKPVIADFKTKLTAYIQAHPEAAEQLKAQYGGK